NHFSSPSARRSIVSLISYSTLFRSCGDSPIAPSTAPYKQTDVRPGTGADATTGALVTVNYTGWLYDAAKLDGKGLQFDTSVGATDRKSTRLNSSHLGTAYAVCCLKK